MSFFSFFSSKKENKSFHTIVMEKIGDFIVNDPFLQDKNKEYFERWFHLSKEDTFIFDEDDKDKDVSRFMNSFIYEYKIDKDQNVLTYIMNQADSFNNDELNYIKEINENNFYSAFDVIDIEVGKSLFVRDILTDREYKISENRGTYDAEKGVLIFARIAKLNDTYVFLYNDGAYMKEHSYAFKRTLSGFKEQILKIGISSLFLHENLFGSKKDQEEQFVEFVNLKKRVKNIFKKIYGKKFTMGNLEKELLALDFSQGIMAPLSRYIDLINSRLQPHEQEKARNDFFAFVEEFCQMKAEKSNKVGEKEKNLIQDFFRIVSSQIGDIADDMEYQQIATKMCNEWLDTPQRELDGKVPREVIIEERKSMGIPSTKIEYSFFRERFQDSDYTIEERAEFLSSMELDQMTTQEIIGELKHLCEFDVGEFKELAKKHISSEDLSEIYYDRGITVTGPQEDFVWMGCTELWKRICPEIPNVEMFEDKVADVAENEDNDVFSLKGVLRLFAILDEYRGFLFDKDGRAKEDVWDKLDECYYDIKYIYTDAIRSCIIHKLFPLAQTRGEFFFKAFDDPRFLNLAAEAQFLNGEQEEAVKKFEKTFDEFRDPYSFLNLAQLFSDQQEYEKAYKVLQNIRSNHEKGTLKLKANDRKKLFARIRDLEKKQTN